MKNIFKLLLILLPALAGAQSIPSGYVNVTATVAPLANGTYGAAWTNQSSSVQLGLLGCQSTFQQTINGNFDASGRMAVIVADTSQICPSPSTWTWTFTFNCSVGSNPSAFMIQVPIGAGGGLGGGSEDITTQIQAALPPNACSGGGGGSGSCTAEGIQGTLQASNGQGGCIATNIEANGAPVLGAPNFVNSNQLTFTSPEPGQISATVTPGSALSIQHNGVSSGIDQAILNFDDTTPAPPGGNQNVTFQTGASGALSAFVPIPSSDLQSQVVVPFVPGVQTVNINATNNVPTSVGVGTASSSNTSAQISHISCNASSPPCNPAVPDTTVVWSGFVLPAGISPANVTDVVAYVSASLSGSGPGAPPILCTDPVGGGSASFVFPVTAAGTFSTTAIAQSFSAAVPGADIPSITCTAANGVVDSNGPQLLSINQINLIVTYTGTAIPNPTTLSVAPPLVLNTASNILGFNPVYNYGISGGSADAYTLTIQSLVASLSLPELPPQQGQEVLWTPSFPNVTTSPSLNLNGSGAVTITKGPGHTALAAGDLNGNVADVIFDGTNWELQNPQTSSGSSGSISVNGTSVSSPNLNGTTPAAPSGSTNCAWAVSGSSVSCSIPTSSSGGVTLTGPVTGSGTGTIATTITPTGVTAGSYTNPNITLNAAGQVTAASNGSGASGITQLTGDATAGPGSGSQALTAVNLPGHIALTGTPSAGQVPTATSGSAATWQTPGGSGSLPSATAPGQIIASTAAGTTYAALNNLFYSQAGDTIASIEAECTSACTYVVTQPQTITLTASHTLSANVNLMFDNGGVWTINGATFTLSIPTQVVGSLTQHFVIGTGLLQLGTATTSANSLIPVEWFGAVGDWNGTVGTNNTTPIQNALNSLVAGQVLLQAAGYEIAGTLTITKSNVGIAGTKYGYHNSSFGAILPSFLEQTSAPVDSIDVSGPGPSFGLPFLDGFIGWNKFTDFSIERNVTPTGTAAGLSLSFVGGAIVDHVVSHDSVRGFYLHAVPAFGIGVIQNSEAEWGFGNAGLPATVYGFYLDSADGNAEDSIRMFHDSADTNGLVPSTTSNGIFITGTSINDVMVDGFETSSMSVGISVNFTGTGGVFQAGDIHFWNCINDGFQTNAFAINNLPATSGANVEIEGGWADTTNSTASAIDIESSQGVKIIGVQITSTSTTALTNGILAQNSSNLVIANNTFRKATGSFVELNNTNDTTISGNAMLSQASMTQEIDITGTSSWNVISGNSVAGTATTGVFFGASTAHNTMLDTTGIDTTSITTAVNNLGPNNTVGVGGGSGGSTTFQNSLLPFPPASSSFTAAGATGSISVTTVGGVLVATIVETNPVNWSFLVQSNAFSTPYSIAAEFSAASPQPQSGGSAQAVGLYLSDGTKFEGIECLQESNGSSLRVEHITNFSTDGSTVFGPNAFVAASTVLPFATSCTQGAMYARWRNNGTTLAADVSPDGVIWQNVYSEAVGSFITPTSYGWGGADNIGDGGILVKLGGWLPTNSATQ